MEDRLALFLFADYEPGVAEVRPAMSSIAGLAAAVIEINGLVRTTNPTTYRLNEEIVVNTANAVYRIQNHLTEPTYQHIQRPGTCQVQYQPGTVVTADG